MIRGIYIAYFIGYYLAITIFVMNTLIDRKKNREEFSLFRFLCKFFIHPVLSWGTIVYFYLYKRDRLKKISKGLRRVFIKIDKFD